jgi:hypothetical protein
MNNADLPAMPFVEGDGVCSVATGLTKREEVASRVLAGFASRMDASDADYAVAWAVGWADAFSKELDKKEPTQ